MVDQFTKIIRLKIITTVVLLKEIDEIYEDYIWKIYRVPKKILSSKSSQFASQFIKDLYKTFIERKSNNKNRISKIRDFP